MASEEKQEKIDHGKILAEWKFPETIIYKRGKVWYAIYSIIAVFLIIYSLVIYNFLFAFIIVLFTLTILIIFKNPNEIDFKIFEDGVVLGSNFYDYKEFSRFWIVYEPPEVKNLYFEFKKSLAPRLVVLLEDQNPAEVRKILLHYMLEDLDEEEESFLDLLSRRLKL